MPTNDSAIWSSLRTLKLTRQFTSAHVEPSKAYHAYIPGGDTDKVIHRHHQKLASALALIGANSPDTKSVTACSVEVSYPNGSDGPEGSGGPEVILRVAQNKGVDEAELAKLQSLVDGLVRKINMQRPNVWTIRDGASFLIWFEFQI
jgi:hypothetical protein